MQQCILCLFCVILHAILPWPSDELNFLLKDDFRQLLQLQSQLGNYEIIKPGRKFIKDGELFKLSRKGRQPRYFILVRVHWVANLLTISTEVEIFNWVMWESTDLHCLLEFPSLYLFFLRGGIGYWGCGAHCLFYWGCGAHCLFYLKECTVLSF